MGNDSPPQVQAAPETPEARRLTELQAQRLEWMNPLEQQALETLTPLQTAYQQAQYGAQQQLLPGQTAQAMQQQGIIQGLMGGQLPPGYEALGKELTPIDLARPDYDQQFQTAQNRLMTEEGRRNAQLLAQQNVAGVLGSGGTYEMLQRSGETTQQGLMDLSTQQAMAETQRLQQQDLLARQAEENLLGRQAGLFNVAMGTGAAASPTGTQANALGGVQSGIQGAGGYIQSQNALQQQSMLQQQQLAMQAAQGSNAFFGDIFGGILGLGGMLGGAALMGSSRTYKDNIKDNTIDSIAVLDEVDVVEFDYKPEFNDTKHRIGMIAEDVPEIIRGGDGKSIDVINTIGVLVDATKKLSKRVEELEGRAE